MVGAIKSPRESKRRSRYSDKVEAALATLEPLNDNQAAYLKAIQTSPQVVCFGPAGCKSGDTVIHYRRGKRNSSRSLTLREFVGKFNGDTRFNGRNWDKNEPTYVQSINQETGEIFYNLVEGAWYTGKKESVRITTNDAGHVDITTDDSLLLEDGTFKKAKNIQTGDRLLCKSDMRCPGSGSKVKYERKKNRVIVEGLKYYSGGWNKFVKEGEKTYFYKRNHRARLVIEALAMGLDYDNYIYDLKNNPNHTHSYVLSSDVEVHHINEDCSDDRVENLKLMTKAEHAALHSKENVKNFNRNFTKVSIVTAVEPLGEIEVYDLTMKAPWHNFVLNKGIIAHNTGKTYIASVLAANLYKQKAIDKIILTRPNIPTGRSLGYFPGTLYEKMAEWCAPVLEVLKTELGREKFENDVKNGNIELVPFETMRGRSFTKTFTILDEAQNAEYEEMKMFVTRIGEDSTTIINGDVSQSDLKRESGLATIVRMIHTHKLPVPIIEFTVDDIVRSGLCREWVMAFIKEETKK